MTSSYSSPEAVQTTGTAALGYEPVLSEKGDIAYTPDIPLDESCYREAAGADVLVLIIGGRYGSERSDSRTGLSRTFFDRYDSITKQEYKSALANSIPIYILVDTQVYAEYQTFQKNKNDSSITYAHVDSLNIFHLLEEILLQRCNNAMSTFSRYTEIKDWLREQWAGFFRELLKRTTQSQEIASLSSQVSELSELNKTLRTYLETLITSISPEESKAIIETESTRLEERQKQAAINDNPFIKFIQTNGKIAPEVARKIIESSSNVDELIENMRELTSPDSANIIENTLRRFSEAQTDLNYVRHILGKPALTFTFHPEINDDSDSVSEPDIHPQGKRVKAPAARRRAAVD